MVFVSIALWIGGVALIAIGYQRARGPYRRYMELKQQDENIARYERWRGGVRDTTPTGASVAMQMLRRQTQVAVAIAIVGFVLVFAGFVVR